MNNYKEIVKELNDLAAKIDAMDKMEETPNKYPEGILSFKNSKGDISRNYESKILPDYQTWCGWNLQGNNPSTIHSVKNSKGEVFTVGDEAMFEWNKVFTIESFEINANAIWAKNNFNGKWIIDSLIKPNPKELKKTITI